MKKISVSLVFVSLLVAFSFSACTGNKTADKKEITPEVQAPIVIGTETTLLLKDLDENGDYVNSQEYPSLIKASVVHESLGENILIVDLRSPELFSEGHIKGAVNKRFEDLPEYFETGIKPFEYDRIIMVSDDGQLSSYTTSLLRLMGYGNVYSMRWGMSAWNSTYARDGWLKGVSGSYESKLENRVNERSPSRGMPELGTGKSTGEDVAASRFARLFEAGTGNVLITADAVFSNPGNYYIVNLDRRDKYEDGHIPGAVRYKPGSTLGFVEEMASIPYDKTVVVYCGTGHNSGFATAYLRLLGYDARTLKYGNNSFMYDKMIKQRTILSWLPFTSEEVNDFEVVR